MDQIRSSNSQAFAKALRWSKAVQGEKMMTFLNWDILKIRLPQRITLRDSPRYEPNSPPHVVSSSENSLKKTQKLISLKFAENCELFDTKIPRNTFSSPSPEGNKIFSCGFHLWRLLKKYYHLNICFMMLAQILKFDLEMHQISKHSFFIFWIWPKSEFTTWLRWRRDLVGSCNSLLSVKSQKISLKE